MRYVHRFLLLCMGAATLALCVNAQNLTDEQVPRKRTSKIQAPKKLWLAMTIATYTTATLDMHATAAAVDRNKRLPGFYWGPPESNPLARPFTELPRPAYYACGLALATGVNWLGYKMAKSHRWRKVWWLPQTISIGGNSYGYQSQRIN